MESFLVQQRARSEGEKAKPRKSVNGNAKMPSALGQEIPRDSGRLITRAQFEVDLLAAAEAVAAVQMTGMMMRTTTRGSYLGGKRVLRIPRLRRRILRTFLPSVSSSGGTDTNFPEQDPG